MPPPKPTKKKLPKNSIGYRVIKHNSESELSESSESSNTSTDSYDTSDSTNKNQYQFMSIVNSNYKKPKGGTQQENMTKEQVKQKLKGYKVLKTMKEKKELLTLQPFKVWIRYFNTITKEFRIGGLLKLVDPDLKYIMLVNTRNRLTWSVQLKDTYIFIPKDIKEKAREKELEKTRKKELEKQLEKQREKEDLIKEKLYKLYINGKLIKR
jgi:hypothetical protein